MTKRQADLLKYIREFWGKNGYCPSYAEMAKAIGVESKGNISRLVVALEERGFINRIPNAARSIQLVETPKQEK